MESQHLAPPGAYGLGMSRARARHVVDALARTCRRRRRTTRTIVRGRHPCRPTFPALPCLIVVAMKKPSPSGEGLVVSGLAPLALVPSSSPPPGAGNEPKYALNAQLERADQTEEGYVHQAETVRRNLHATTVRPYGDGDVAAIPAIEQTQPGSP
jgi:hypothetical protein